MSLFLVLFKGFIKDSKEVCILRFNSEGRTILTREACHRARPSAQRPGQFIEELLFRQIQAIKKMAGWILVYLPSFHLADFEKQNQTMKQNSNIPMMRRDSNKANNSLVLCGRTESLRKFLCACAALWEQLPPRGHFRRRPFLPKTGMQQWFCNLILSLCGVYTFLEVFSFFSAHVFKGQTDGSPKKTEIDCDGLRNTRGNDCWLAGFIDYVPFSQCPCFARRSELSCWSRDPGHRLVGDTGHFQQLFVIPWKLLASMKACFFRMSLELCLLPGSLRTCPAMQTYCDKQRALWEATDLQSSAVKKTVSGYIPNRERPHDKTI